MKQRVELLTTKNDKIKQNTSGRGDACRDPCYNEQLIALERVQPKKYKKQWLFLIKTLLLQSDYRTVYCRLFRHCLAWITSTYIVNAAFCSFYDGIFYIEVYSKRMDYEDPRKRFAFTFK